jgi:hypothetical protein
MQGEARLRHLRGTAPQVALPLEGGDGTPRAWTAVGHLAACAVGRLSPMAFLVGVVGTSHRRLLLQLSPDGVEHAADAPMLARPRPCSWQALEVVMDATFAL